MGKAEGFVEGKRALQIGGGIDEHSGATALFCFLEHPPHQHITDAPTAKGGIHVEFMDLHRSSLKWCERDAACRCSLPSGQEHHRFVGAIFPGKAFMIFAVEERHDDLGGDTMVTPEFHIQGAECFAEARRR